MMNSNEITKALNRIKNGTFFRVQYKREMGVKAAYKNDVSITRYAESTFRTGINYSHMAVVIAERNAEDYVAPKPRVNNETWTIKNKILHNDNTNKDYAYLIPRSHTTKCYYVVVINGVEAKMSTLSDDVKAYLRDSELTPKAPARVKKISFENIISIG